MRQYRDGAVFVRAVVDEVGMDGFNRVWTSPETLPLPRGDRGARGVGGARPRLSRRPRVTGPHPGGRRGAPGRATRARHARPRCPRARGCSGGADSLALAAALAFEAPKLGHRAPAPSSSTTACRPAPPRRREAAAQCRGLGLDPVEVVAVPVAPAAAGPRPPPATPATPRSRTPPPSAWAPRRAARPHPRRPGREGAAGPRPRLRRPVALRYAAPGAGRYAPSLPRALPAPRPAAACAASGLRPWDDPHNDDPAYARVRARAGLLARWRRRSARASPRRWPARPTSSARTPTPSTPGGRGREPPGGRRPGRRRGPRGAVPRAVRTRLWRLLLIAAGAPAGALSVRPHRGVRRAGHRAGTARARSTCPAACR